MKTQLKQLLELDTVVTPIVEPTVYRPPTPPPIAPPTIIPPPIPWLNPFGKLKKKKKGKQDLFTKLYLPDFTARALGLKEETLTGKQAQAKLKKIMTGFELRRGVKIRN